MKLQFVDGLNKKSNNSVPLDSQVNVLNNLLKKMMDKGTIKSRITKYKLENYVNSKNVLERLYALNKIVSDGKGLEIIPDESEAQNALENTNNWIAEILAERYVKNSIEKEVEKNLIERQDKYMDDIRLNIIKKQKGCENAKTLKKYAELEIMDSKTFGKNIQELLRPENFKEIVGQERAIKSMISKIASPYPQHIILYGPPGVGKTTAARIALEEAKKLKFTPFGSDAKFVEVDGSTLRWDPREITDPLLGSVHDPIYQGTKRDLAETGIPEPKLGLVTEAHGGVLFIDEIGELDEMLQNKLLKVLEDKRVQFSSSYYDPDDENIPKYIRYLFKKGAPANFLLIGATTRDPSEINPALRSRCTEVYFEPLSTRSIQKIVENAAERLHIEIEDGVSQLISKYTIEGRKAVNILSDAYGYALYSNKIDNLGDRVYISVKDLQRIISISRLVPFEETIPKRKYEVGHIYGLGVLGYIGSTVEIESVVFKAKESGKGVVRFNDTAGSMAKDSVFNAASVIRKITDKDIGDYDIHVNVIGGGKIDGPSAGAAITVCIISALLNKPLRQDIAVTGEISLRGNIKPVGGIFEKIYGAKRKGIKTVLIPEENLRDLSNSVEDVEIRSISNVEELMDMVFK
ncbi:MULTISPECIES: Lon family ATP-dependent protease [Clostridium]|uniref:endopeptidase La n=1 Tax=Clostridium lapidicellarium TaxID=3240931 RepID=A0ABV4DXA2_9CLOT|nr:Lon family ATP-dependent protease [uncultured Clostridium sp.]